MKSKAVDALLRRADVVLLPVLPSLFDEAATARFLTRLEELKPVARDRARVVIVANRLRRRTRAAARLDGFLAEARLEQAAGARGLTVAARLSDSQLYAEAAALGLGLFDMPGQRAAALREEWSSLLELLA
jgi:chromosome partitioning protein